MILLVQFFVENLWKVINAVVSVCENRKANCSPLFRLSQMADLETGLEVTGTQGKTR